MDAHPFVDPLGPPSKSGGDIIASSKGPGCPIPVGVGWDGSGSIPPGKKVRGADSLIITSDGLIHRDGDCAVFGRISNG